MVHRQNTDDRVREYKNYIIKIDIPFHGHIDDDFLNNRPGNFVSARDRAFELATRKERVNISSFGENYFDNLFDSPNEDEYLF